MDGLDKFIQTATKKQLRTLLNTYRQGERAEWQQVRSIAKLPRYRHTASFHRAEAQRFHAGIVRIKAELAKGATQ